MYENLKDKALAKIKRERVKKKSVHTVGIIFTAVSILLFVISMNFHGSAEYWIKFPILILALVYAIIYFSTFGVPFLGLDEEISDEEIEREIVKIYKQQSKEGQNNANNSEELELKEIESLKNKWDNDDEFV
jgi:hypothetical protein